MSKLSGEVLTLPKMSGSVSTPKPLNGSVGGKTINIGEDGATFIPSVSADGVISWTNDKELPNPDPVNIKGEAGYTPQKGVDYFDGKNGADGKDGYTPQKGVDYFDGKDGQNGSDGKDGQDGTSPIISVSAITGGHRITITDKNGTKSVDVLDGQDGKEGSDGADGQDGADGVGIASIEQTTTSTADDGNNVITITLTNGQTATFTVQNGSRGSIGPAGKDGSDATVTAANIKSALNYTPANQEEVNNISKEIVNLNENKQPKGDYALKNEIPSVPVQSVNGKTGAVSLSAQDVSADPAGTAETKVSEHNISTVAHNDIRLLIEGLTTRLNALANSDDTTLDQMAEVVAYIKSNRTLIESVTTDKVNVLDIVNNLTTNVPNKPLSAAQGVVLKGLIDTLQTAVNNIKVPTKTSELTNDSGFLTQHQSLADYAKKTELPTKTSQLINDSGFLTQHQDLSAYAKKTDIPSVPTKTSQLTNDSGFLTSVPTEYVTETELAGKGYATQTSVNNLSKEIVNLQPKGNYALKSDIDGLSLGIGEDGRIYLLRNGVAQGNGVELPVGETGDVIGNIGENNIIMLNGDIADGTYTVKYEMENGTVINIGNMVLDSNVYYSITNNLTNCTINNSTTKVIENNSYSATITPKSGYKLSSVTVTMGGTNITSSSVSGGTINIAKVTGAIVITATAVEDVPAYTNLADPTSADWWNNAYFGSDGTKRTSADPYVCTNYIGPLNVGDVVRIKNLNCNGTAAGYKCVPYKSDKTIHGSYGVAGLTGFNGNAASNVTVTGTTAQFTNAKSDVKYWRIGGKLTGTANDVIITINEPID